MDDRLLIRRAQNGDRRATTALLKRYEPLTSNARRFAPTYDLRDDFEQAARIGVVYAIERYKPEKGRKPSYFFFESVKLHVVNYRQLKQAACSCPNP